MHTTPRSISGWTITGLWLHVGVAELAGICYMTSLVARCIARLTTRLDDCVCMLRAWKKT
jgi:hypothetical protein